MAEYDLMLDHDETFSMAEFKRICDEYVCAVCHANLTPMFAEARDRVLIICLEHGNVTHCGRVTRSTVSIEMERAHRKFKDVIRNLPDLWGELAPQPRTQSAILSELGF